MLTKLNPSPFIDDDEEDPVFDEDNPEWTLEDFKNARPASEVLPPKLYAALVANQQARKAARGKQVAPKLKAITLRLDEATLNAFKATGKGWQGRMRAILQKAVKP